MKLAKQAAVHLRFRDHGRRISERLFDAATTQEGLRFELIDGRVYVSPAPDQPHDDLIEWLSST